MLNTNSLKDEQAQPKVMGGGCPVMHGSGNATDNSSDALSIPENDSNHDGYFASDSVSWRLFADPSTKLGGVAAILLQSLNPMMMQVFNASSSYTDDVEGRSERTGKYLDTTIFGDKAHADAAAAAVRKLHERSVWLNPQTGQEMRADNEEWLAWTHNSLMFGILAAAEAFGPQISRFEQDQFLQEQVASARLIGISNMGLVPTTFESLIDYIDANKNWMALTLPAAEISHNLRKPQLRGNPIKVWVAINVQDGILSLLPDWALLLFGIDGRPMNMKAAAKVTKRLMASARKRKSTDELIGEITSRVQTHPYRKVR